MRHHRLFMIISLLYHASECHPTETQNIKELFENINRNLLKHNAISAEIAWKSTVNPDDPELPERAARYETDRIHWQHPTCDLLKQLERDHLLNTTQRRQAYLLCRGPKWLIPEAREVSSLYDDLQNIYSNSRVCIPANASASKSPEAAILKFLNENSEFVALGASSNLLEKIENRMCFQGENDFENLMRSRNEQVLRWTWLMWRETVGPPMREPYKHLVDIENRASRRNGYSDVGTAWRDELEAPRLRGRARALYGRMRPLYAALHGVARYFLRARHGHLVPERAPIPAHLTGDLWSQNWGHLIELIVPASRDYDLEHSMHNTNWTVLDMVRRAEDFYASLSLPPMTRRFWERSVFGAAGAARCHGTAADMFTAGDFRMLYCAKVSMQDFYVIHHEMGHIQYYMAYQDQPAVFREGTNSAFHETIGDAIMNGVMSPQHLHRLGLINDTLLFSEANSLDEKFGDTRNNTVEYFINFIKKKERTNRQLKKMSENKVIKELLTPPEEKELRKRKMRTPSFDEIHLLKQALVKIPQIPFSLLVDEYRWALFEGKFDESAYNGEFWKLVQELQGVMPPGAENRGEEYFDAGAKFHVPDNTPYIRYFLSSFLQAQVFRSLCRAAVLGGAHAGAGARLPRHLPLHRCDIYGSKQAGHLLRYFLSSFLQAQVFRSLCRAAVLGGAHAGAGARLPRHLPLHRCDIYGSKQAGHLLRRTMSQGASIHWREALHSLTGEREISPDALLQYYRPIFPLLMNTIDTYNIPIGW